MKPLIIFGLAIAFNFALNAGAAMQTEPRAWLGVYLGPVTEDDAAALQLDSTKGVLVNDVIPDSPAKEAGFLANDVIRRMDDKEIETVPDLQSKIRAGKPGQVIKIVVIRDGKQHQLEVKLGQRPAQVPQEEVPH